MKRCCAIILMSVVLGGAALAPAAADPIRIRGGWVSAPNIMLPFIFEKKEVLRHYGKSYVFESARYTSTSLEVSAMTIGELELASLAYSALGTAVLNAGLDNLRIVADGIQDGVEGYYTTEYMVLKDGPVKTIEDVKGKVVSGTATGSAVDMPLRVMLRKHNMEAGRDYTTVETGFPNIQPMLAEGKIALGATTTPFGLAPKTREVSRTLFTSREAIGRSQLIVLAMRADFIAKNRAALVDFFEDYLRALRWFIDPANRTDATAIVATFMKQPPERFDYLFTKSDFYRDPNGVPDIATLQQNIDMQRDLGFLRGSFDVRKYVDLSLIEEAAKRLK